MNTFNLQCISFNCSNFVSPCIYSCVKNNILRNRKYSFFNEKSNPYSNINFNRTNTISSNLVTTFNSRYSSDTDTLLHSKKNSLSSTHLSPSSPSETLDTSRLQNIFVITVPQKIWRKKAPTKYIPFPPHPEIGL